MAGTWRRESLVVNPRRDERSTEGMCAERCKDGGQPGLDRAACKGDITCHMNDGRPRLELTQSAHLTQDTFPRLPGQNLSKDSSQTHSSQERGKCWRF